MAQSPYKKTCIPQYESLQPWEFYLHYPPDEYLQSFDEGLDIEGYKALFYELVKMPQGEVKKAFSDALFDLVMSAEMRPDYPYTEPSDLEGIRALRRAYPLASADLPADFEKKVYGAWMGRVCGCMLGKSVEGIRLAEFNRLLQATDNYPLHRYILRSDIEKVNLAEYTYPLRDRPYADTIDGMPADDDTNYTVFAQWLISTYGLNFTSADVLEGWIRTQPKDAYCTAERVAFCNYIKGYRPPDTATFQNPYREWIGAQIRTDYYGYICPGDPARAAEFAFRDAAASHVKNGIYGAMFVSAMLAAAAVTSDIRTVIEAGLAEIPHTSRLYEEIRSVLADYENGTTAEACIARIHETYDENQGYCWCHTVSNAMIVVAALLYGEKDYGRSICLAVGSAFDTDCNGATVGSILGMIIGIDEIPDEWKDPINDTLCTALFGMDRVSIADVAHQTLKHVQTART